MALGLVTPVTVVWDICVNRVRILLILLASVYEMLRTHTHTNPDTLELGQSDHVIDELEA